MPLVSSGRSSLFVFQPVKSPIDSEDDSVDHKTLFFCPQFLADIVIAHVFHLQVHNSVVHVGAFQTGQVQGEGRLYSTLQSEQDKRSLSKCSTSSNPTVNITQPKNALLSESLGVPLCGNNAQSWSEEPKTHQDCGRTPHPGAWVCGVIQETLQSASTRHTPLTNNSCYADNSFYVCMRVHGKIE